ncbi:MAG: cardiolipin synthase B [Methylotenera sp. 24-45-7]|jgi:cardiolipin synthase|nr:MAG: cardiolipin synthase B [Mehylophilales bacterium 35-46-6]OYZ40278.1 MAG: cardiolipin synthase B [Methylotenera sp. 24-45-7]OZA09560.1 MAG: cardiolipin synthase B [Methylotenera sp. 17-45-7]HQS37141.1 cardiolipin synthase ClsB [Methylotenera sp.]HQS43369.1 cardiolipin synthase ClsB [Methylotenera sp.]
MQFVAGNEIKLLRNGVEYFPALEAAIHSAQHEIYLQAYIYEHDRTGIRIGKALVAAAQRGVAVNVLLDGFGSQHLPKSYVASLRSDGVKVMFYRPKISPWTLKKNRLRRLHSKVVVIDGIIAFVGGINVIDDENSPHQIPPRMDYAVKITGNLLPAISSNVHKLWRRMQMMHLHRLYVPPISETKPHLHASNEVKAAFVIRDNILHRYDIENAYLEAIQSAKNEIIIANAYFIPGRKFRRALREAAKRGVKVTLLLQGRKEYFLMFATHAFYNEFLDNGIEIFEYRKSFMHCKVAVIDQIWSTVGSSNIDPFSLLLARESNVFVKNETFACTLRADIETLIANGSLKITPQTWGNASLLKRLASWLAYGLVRFFVGMIGYKH